MPQAGGSQTLAPTDRDSASRLRVTDPRSGQTKRRRSLKGGATAPMYLQVHWHNQNTAFGLLESPEEACLLSPLFFLRRCALCGFAGDPSSLRGVPNRVHATAQRTQRKTNRRRLTWPPARWRGRGPTECPDLPIRRLGHPLEKPTSILVGPLNHLPAVAPAHDMIPAITHLNSQSSRHATSIPGLTQLSHVTV